VAFVRTAVSEEGSASIVRVTRVGAVGTTCFPLHSFRRLLVTVNVVLSSLVLVDLVMEALRFSETSILSNATRHNISEDGIPHSRRRENLKSYITLTG
jgi:hypothetical protein